MASDISYVATGFYEDCNKLLQIFKENGSIRFDAFCFAWKQQKFSLVFLGRKNYAELLEFCEESLNIVKKIILSYTELQDQVGGLYLLYGLFYKIPVDNVKIRVTLAEWKIFLNLHEQIKEKKLHDASYIFVKLISDNAFYHCLFPIEYGLEKNLKVRQDLSIDNPFSTFPKIIEEAENFSDIQKLSKIYDEQKSRLLNDMSTKNKLQLFDKDGIDEILDVIDSLQEKRQTLTGLRKKLKEVPFSKKEKSEKKYCYDDRIRPKVGHGFDTDSSDSSDDIEFNFENLNNECLLPIGGAKRVLTKQELTEDETEGPKNYTPL